MNDTVISVENLSKRYRLGVARADTLRDRLSHLLRSAAGRSNGGRKAQPEEFWALRDVSFDVKRGEVIGIIGRNGAGKSTLLKILSRITEPTQGRIRIKGRVASLLEVGTGFHPELTGRENISLNGAILGMGRAEIQKKFDEIVAFAEVERFLDTPVKHYSSGMYVRLAFAVAAHLEPEILIIDEVLAVGDIAFQQKCLGKMESVAKNEGRTVLFVSHNISAVARFCQRGLLLQNGVLKVDAAVERAIDAYVGENRPNETESIILSGAGDAGPAPVQLTALTLNRGAPLVNRRPFEATLRFRATKPVPQVGFGMGFCSIDGRRVITLESDYDGRFMKLDQSGDYAITLSVPVLDLIPGRYRIDVGTFGGGHAGFHYVPDCAIVDVQPSANTPPHLHNIYGDWRPCANWQLQPNHD